MKLSIIIPAFNEARVIENCVQCAADAVRLNSNPGFEGEIVVVDNNSTDQTAELAGQAGAKVVFEPHNQIARARNAGAQAATGDWLLFLDADTLLPPETLADALAEMARGDIVGGTSILNYGRPPLRARPFVMLCNFAIRRLKMTAGCFLFCRGDVFRDLNGFDETFYAGEDAEFGKVLKRLARQRRMSVAILHRHPPLTSDRKFRQHGLRGVLLAVARYIFLPKHTMRDKRHLDIFYGERK